MARKCDGCSFLATYRVRVGMNFYADRRFAGFKQWAIVWEKARLHCDMSAQAPTKRYSISYAMPSILSDIS